MKTKIIGLYNVKGGVGKSTITTMLATYYQEKNQNLDVIVIDVDTQLSIMSKRKTDLNLNEKEKFIDLQKTKIFTAIQDDGETDINKLLKSLKNTENKLIVLDLPGTRTKEISMAILQCDIVIVPLAPSYLDFSATLPALALLNELVPNAEKLILWNKVKSSEKTAYIDAFDEYFKENIKGINVLENRLKDIITFKNEASTLISNSKIKALAEEINNKYKLI